MDRVPPFLVLLGFAISIVKSLRNLHDAVFALTPPYELKNIFSHYWSHRIDCKLYGIARANRNLFYEDIIYSSNIQKFTILIVTIDISRFKYFSKCTFPYRLQLSCNRTKQFTPANQKNQCYRLVISNSVLQQISQRSFLLNNTTAAKHLRSCEFQYDSNNLHFIINVIYYNFFLKYSWIFLVLIIWIPYSTECWKNITEMLNIKVWMFFQRWIYVDFYILLILLQYWNKH